AETYLNLPAVLEAARRTGAEAVHPGYGFFSERGDVAEAVEEAGLVWIGPPPEATRAVGDKVRARQLASEAGVSVVPGTLQPVVGEAMWLGARDCSLQRRHQKLVEETPPPLHAALVPSMGEAAVAVANACGYVNAGTVEFLVDEDGRFYFLEVNARLQVEHTI